MKKIQYDSMRLKLDGIYKKFIGRFELKNNPYIDEEYLNNSYKSSINQLDAIYKRLYKMNTVYTSSLIEKYHKYRNEIEDLYNSNIKLLENRRYEYDDDILKAIVMDYFRQ